MKKIIVGIKLLLITATVMAGPWSNSDYNSGVNLKQSAGNECYFRFPTGSDHINLIQRAWNKSLRKGGTLSVTYKIRTISGIPKFKSLDTAPVPPALAPNFRFMLFSGDWYDDNGRFWPSGTNCAWLIADGQIHTYTVKIDPKMWTNVYGKYNASAFQSLLSHPQLFLAFGGGNSFSHGDYNVGGSTVVVIIKVVSN